MTVSDTAGTDLDAVCWARAPVARVWDREPLRLRGGTSG